MRSPTRTAVSRQAVSMADSCCARTSRRTLFGDVSRREPMQEHAQDPPCAAHKFSRVLIDDVPSGPYFARMSAVGQQTLPLFNLGYRLSANFCVFRAGAF